MYADDTKIFRTISTPDDCITLQADLDKIHSWTNEWLLKLHPQKCHILHLGNKSDPSKYQFSEIDTPLLDTNCEKDLGITTDSNLSFNIHINNQVNKANKIMGMIRRTFSHLTISNFRSLYLALVRPYLDYASSVWSPHHVHLINEIESVQRRATKLVPELRHLTYPERLEKLKITTLRFRRIRGDLIECYKIFHQYSCKNTILPTHANPRSRNHPLQIIKQHCRTNKYLHAFRNRVVNIWNNLPQTIVTAPSTNAFKNRLDKFFHNDPRIYDPTSAINIMPFASLSSAAPLRQ